MQAAAIRHLVSGAVLCGFGKWAAGVAALAALRRAIATPLTSWANASLARAYRAWSPLGLACAVQRRAFASLAAGARALALVRWREAVALNSAAAALARAALLHYAQDALVGGFGGFAANAAALASRASVASSLRRWTLQERAKAIDTWSTRGRQRRRAAGLRVTAGDTWLRGEGARALSRWARAAITRALGRAAAASVLYSSSARGLRAWLRASMATHAACVLAGDALRMWARGGLARALRCWALEAATMSRFQRISASAGIWRVRPAFGRWRLFARLRAAGAAQLQAASWYARLCTAQSSLFRWNDVAAEQRRGRRRKLADTKTTAGLSLRLWRDWALLCRVRQDLATGIALHWAVRVPRASLLWWAQNSAKCVLRAPIRAQQREIVLAATLAAWRANPALVRAARASVEAWRSTALRVVLCAWARVGQRAARLLGVGATAHWQQRKVEMAFDGWFAVARGKEMQAAAIRHIVGGAFLRGFATWAAGVAALAALRRAIATPLTSWANHSLAAAWRGWASTSTERALLRRCAQGFAHSETARRLHLWRDHRRAQHALKRALAPALGRWQFCAAAAASDGWFAMARGKAMQAQALRSLVGGALLRSFAKWAAGVAALAALRRAIATPLTSWANASLARAYRSWAAVARGKAMQAAAIFHFVGGALLRGFTRWAGAHSRAAAAKALAAESVGRWASAGSHKALRTWAGIALSWAHATTLLHQAVSVWRARLLGLGLRRWLASSSQVLASARGLRGPVPHLFALWRDATRRSQALLGLAAGVATRWELGGLLAAYAAWREVARGRRLQLTALAYLAHGTFLRGFDKWAAGVAALAALRRAIATPLTSWANHSLAAAWRGWASASTERALIRRCAQGFAHGETARRLHLWRDHRRSQHAVKRALAPAFGRWQICVAAAAFDSWFAVARAKAMQAQALRSLVGGALLRGFAKWVAGVAALAALRLAIATLLTSWANASLARAYHSWAAVARGKAMQAAAILHLVGGALLRGFGTWVTGVAALAALRSAIATPLTSWANASLARAYRSWVAMARGKAMQAAAIRHLLTGALLRGFAAWAGVHSRAAAAKALAAESVGRWASAGSRKALRTWAGIALSWAHATSLLRQAVSVWRARLLGLGLRRWLASSSQVLASARGLRGPVPHLFALWRDATRRSQALLGLAAGAATRWELGGLLAAYAAWREVARVRRLELTALAYLAHGAFLRGLNKWAAGVLAKRKLVSPLAHWANASLARAYRSWAAVARAAIRHIVGGVLLRGFATWAAGVVVLAAARALFDSQLAHWANASLAQAYRSWAAVARGKAMQAAAIRHLVGGAMLRGFSEWAASVAALAALCCAIATPLTSWANHSLADAWRGWASASTERALMRTCAQTFAHGETARRLHLWRDHRRSQHAVKRAMAPALGHWQMRATAPAFDCLAASARGKAMQAAAIRHLVGGALLRGFAKWAFDLAMLRSVRALLSTPLGSWADRTVSAVWRSWSSAAVTRALMRTSAQTLAVRRFLVWVVAAAERKAATACLALSARRWLAHKAAAAFDGWAASARGKAMQVAAVRHLVGGAVLRGFAKWAVGVAALAALRRAIATPLTSWANASLARALRSWAAVARGKAMQAVAFRHLVGGAVLRGFAKWAAGAAALAALRHAIATPLTSLASASLAHALRSWAAVARGKAMQAAALRQMMFGAFLRGFSKWAAGVAALAAFSRAIATPLTSWANASLARAYRSWVAVARGKAMQAAALRQMMFGAFLRGFSKWAAGVAALAALRRAIATPLTSWANHSLAAAWRGWASASTERALIRRCAHGFAHGETARRLHLWRDHRRAHHAVKCALNLALNRLLQTARLLRVWRAFALTRGAARSVAGALRAGPGARAAFAQLAGCAYGGAVAARELRVAARQWASSALGGSFGSWMRSSRIARLRARYARRCVARAEVRALRSWAGGARGAALCLAAAGRWAAAATARALGAWAVALDAAAHARLAFRFWVGVSAGGALVAWRGVAAERKLAALLLPAGQRRFALRTLADALERWLAQHSFYRVCLAQTEQCRSIATLIALERGTHALVAAAACAGGDLDELRDSVRSRGKLETLSLALRAWAELTDARAIGVTIVNMAHARQRARAKLTGLARWRSSIVTGLARALAQADQGVAEGRSFALWREASWAELRVRVITDVLSARASRALVSFSMWASAARADALFRRGTAQWTSGALGALWLRWAGATAARIAGLLLTSQGAYAWQQRKTAMAFDGWFAVAHSKATQAADLVGGALLRGFAKWAAGMAALAALRRAIATPLTSWANASLARALRSWAAVARSKAMQAAALRQMMFGAFLCGFAKWAAGVAALAALSRAIATPLTSWANAWLARALRSWAVVARGKAMQAAAVRHLVGGAVLRGFAKWAAGVAALAALHCAITTPLTSWANHSLSAAWRGWASVSVERALMRTCAQTFAHGETARRLHLWRDSLRAQAAIKHALALALGRWQMRATAAAFDGWDDSACGKAMQAASIRHLVGGALLRGFAKWAAGMAALAALRCAIATPQTSWTNHSLAAAWRGCASASTERALIRRYAQGFAYGETARRLQLWRNHRRTQTAVKRALASALGRWKIRATAAAFGGWAASARGKAMQAQALRRLVGGALLRGFAKWASDLAMLRSARALLSTPLGSWADRTVSAVWRSWSSAAATRALMRTCAQTLAVRRFLVWVVAAAERKAAAARLALSARRWLAHKAAATFDGWAASARGKAMQAGAIRHLVGGAVLRGFAKWAVGVAALAALRRAIATPLTSWANASLARALRSWAAVARGKAMQAAAIRHLVSGAVLRGFAKWAVGVAALAAARALLDSPLAHWVNVSIARAYCSWAAVARGKAMQAVAIRHLVGGAVLRGFSKWAACVAALAALRLAIATPLTSWINASLARALRSWAAVARGKAMQAAAISHLVGGAVLRGLAKWAEGLAALAAARTLLDSPLAHWVNVSLARAYRSWAAVARGKAMQAAAMRQMMFGAFLRGFAKLTVGVAALGTLRRAIATPLTSWANASLARAYRSWAASARGKEMQAAAIRHLVGGALLRGFAVWAGVHGRATAAKALMAESVGRLASAGSRKALRTWAGIALLRARTTSLLRQAVSVWRARLLGLGLHRWLASSSQVLASARGLRGPVPHLFALWRDATRRSQALLGLAAGVAMRWELGGVLAAYAAWREVACGRRLQLTALAHLAHGAFLRGFDKWAAG
ncbi:hypothetical protein T492DRAFT_911093, partial [Pavlovales sp. CCMP2436]